MSAHNNLNTNDIIFVTRTREMVSFELGEEIGKDVFRLLTSVKKEKLLSPHEESSLISSDSIFEHQRTKSHGLGFDSSWGPRIFFFFFYTLVTRRTTSFSTLLLL